MMAASSPAVVKYVHLFAAAVCLSLIIGAALAADHQMKEKPECLTVPAKKLSEESFRWSGEESPLELAERTVYRSTSSWFAREVLLFDPDKDVRLQEFLEYLRVSIRPDMEISERIQVCFDLVRHALAVDDRLSGVKREEEDPLAFGGEVIRIGRYITRKQGVCRHVNFLLKIALQAISITDVAMIRGTTPDNKRHIFLQYNNSLLDAMWYDKAMPMEVMENSLRFDDASVPLGKCGTTWSMEVPTYHPPKNDKPHNSRPAGLHNMPLCDLHTLWSSLCDQQTKDQECSPGTPFSLETVKNRTLRARPKVLRTILTKAKRSCKGCLERSDFANEVLQLSSFGPQPCVFPSSNHGTSGHGQDKDSTGDASPSWFRSILGVICSVIFFLWTIGFAFVGQKKKRQHAQNKDQNKAKEPPSRQGQIICAEITGAPESHKFINGKYHLMNIRHMSQNGRPVYVKMKSNTNYTNDSKDLAIWWTANSWHCGLLNEFGLNRAFAFIGDSAFEPYNSKGIWTIAGAAYPTITCTKVVQNLTATFNDSAMNSLDEERIRQQLYPLVNSRIDWISQMWGHETYSHCYPFDHSAGNRRGKFINGVTIHRMLSSHPNPAVRNAVVPFVWASIDASGSGGITLTGKGLPFDWSNLGVSERCNAVLQLWENLTALHSAGIAHYDVKKDNVVLHNGRLKFIDFDNSVIEEIDVGPAVKVDINRHITFRAPENLWSAQLPLPDSKQYAYDVFCLGMLSCEILRGALEPVCGTILKQVWHQTGTVLPYNSAILAILQGELDNRVLACPAEFNLMFPALKAALRVIPSNRAAATNICDSLKQVLSETIDAQQ